MVFTLLDGVVSLACLGLSYVIYASSHTPSPDNTSVLTPAYILRSTTSHARFLPADSRHAFTYPVLSLLLPLSALESGRLSLLNGFLFSFGGIYWRILGMRPAGYLYDDGGREASIRKKLVNALRDFGVEHAEEQMDDAWILTMPSYCGFEGINPLTVYFCYRKGYPNLWVVVLEIHNTFGERHVHILEVGKNEEPPDAKFDHQWSFRRAFHVSPFNDRLGTYTVSIRAPFPHCMPMIRIHLHTPEGLLKFSASLRAMYAAPFRTHTVLAALLAHPFIFFLTLPRILYQAAVLHYRRRLNAYKRPEPKPVKWTTASTTTTTTTTTTATANAPALIGGGGIGWQHPTLLEGAARRTVGTFLARRAKALGVDIMLQPGDPSAKTQSFRAHHEEPAETDSAARELVISYLSPRFFTLLLLADDARTALRRGGGLGVAGDVREFVVSDEALFCDVFDADAAGDTGHTWPARLLRLLPRSVPGDVQYHRSSIESERYPHAHPHPLFPETRLGQLGFVVLLCALIALEWAEELLWRVARVRWAVADPCEPR